MPLIVVAALIELVIVVHILRSGRERYWIFVVLLLPLLGSLLYLFAEVYPPTARQFSAWRARRRRAGFKAVTSPGRAPAISRQIDEAQDCLDAGRYQRAAAIYRRCLVGAQAGDPQLMLGLAQALFGLGEFARTTETLDRLKQLNPDYRSNEGHLIYARAHEALGDMEAASHEYDALCRYFPGPEAQCRYASMLLKSGDTKRAGVLFAEVVEHSATAGLHYNTIYRQWIDLARRHARSAEH